MLLLLLVLLLLSRAAIARRQRQFRRPAAVQQRLERPFAGAHRDAAAPRRALHLLQRARRSCPLWLLALCSGWILDLQMSFWCDLSSVRLRCSGAEHWTSSASAVPPPPPTPHFLRQEREKQSISFDQADPSSVHLRGGGAAPSAAVCPRIRPRVRPLRLLARCRRTRIIRIALTALYQSVVTLHQ